MKRSLLALLTLCACESHEVVIARLPASDASVNDASGLPAGCQDSLDCAADEFCEKGGCDDAFGTCRPSPTSCEAKPNPVCGCDGLTYFNDCLRQQHAVLLAATGECMGRVKRCDGEHICPASSYCGKLGMAGICPPDMIGKCWVIPDCDANAVGVEHLLSCDAPTQCADLCTAIQSQKPYQRGVVCSQ